MKIIEDIARLRAANEERMTAHLSKTEQELYYRRKLEKRNDWIRVVAIVVVAWMAIGMIFTAIYLAVSGWGA